MLASLGLLTGCVAPTGRKKPLSLEAIFGPQAANFNGAPLRGLKWLPDGEHYLERRDGALQKVNALTGEATPAYDHAAVEAALRENEDFDEAAARQLARHPTLFSEDRTVALLEHKDRLYLYRFEDQTLRRLTKEAEPRRELTLSPDQTYVGFVKDNNLYTLATADGRITQLTHDGSETLLNGVLDWVYQEEIYGRGNWRAYWWSKDARWIAYLRLDQSEVPTYPLISYLPTHPTVTTMRYPKAGDPNPQVQLGLVKPNDGDTRWVDLSDYEGTDILITRVSWTPDGHLLYGVQDRESRWLDLNEVQPESGQQRTLLHEQTPAWIEFEHPPHWLDDGTFLWRSPRDGWEHLYHYTRDGQLIRRLTEGPWEVRDLHGVDQAAGWVYFSATRDNPVEKHAYRVALTGGGIERLTEPGYSHSVNFDPRLQYFIDTFSNITTPTKVYLRRASGELVRVLSENEVAALGQYRLSTPQLLRVPTPAGHELNALLIRPPNFSRHRKYPVITFVYAGPHAQMVHNRWGGRDYIFHQWLAQQGYLVWACDPYSASTEGALSAWRAYQQLGVTELEDLETSLRWLATHANADLNRTAIVGHSYGGYMAAYALTHGSLFKAGIAIALVADWRNYDSIYTERYMRTPQNNPDGYQKSSVLAAAGQLHGRLLILHGMRDDNVHVQNAMQLMHALQQAGRPFEVMIYPDDDHGVSTYYSQWQQLGLDFIRRCFERPSLAGDNTGR